MIDKGFIKLYSDNLFKKNEQNYKNDEVISYLGWPVHYFLSFCLKLCIILFDSIMVSFIRSHPVRWDCGVL